MREPGMVVVSVVQDDVTAAYGGCGDGRGGWGGSGVGVINDGALG